ncbi:hypothetical protein LTR37_021177 [Vermiconidia calcicola]|uniref:Uncharacterized protein n=1 Tax=Vermiconidia calcicola TaxID=1690605 RepID=A0ACC3M9B5_9PEZI|nr:hypothetical protein LTR37_021177 [Vermiconidia calcicola]
MERVHLPTVYATGEFADCTVISASGEKFPAHRLVLAQFPRLKELVAVDRRVQLPESTEVVERVLRYMYEADLAPTPDDVQPTRKAVGRELMDVMGLVEAARKYEIPKLADAAYSKVGNVIGHVTNAEAGLRILRDLTNDRSTEGALQRTVIDRILSLIKEAPIPRIVVNEQKLENGDEEEASATAGAEQEYPDIIRVPKKSGRPKKPTEKVKVKEYASTHTSLLDHEANVPRSAPKARKRQSAGAKPK